jgi:hypothetical protein
MRQKGRGDADIIDVDQAAGGSLFLCFVEQVDPPATDSASSRPFHGRFIALN